MRLASSPPPPVRRIVDRRPKEVKCRTEVYYRVEIKSEDIWKSGLECRYDDLHWF